LKTEEDDRTAILDVLKAESDAWLRRDLEALSSYWLQTPQARRMSSLARIGTHVENGWTEIRATFDRLAEQYPKSYHEDRVRRENINLVICADAAWLTFDQIGEKGEDDFEMAGVQHELRVFQRVDRSWKIACIVVLQRTIDHETCPLIEVSAAKKVMWINSAAHEQLSAHSHLCISGGTLWARNQNAEKSLRDAILWASRHLHWSAPHTQTERLAQPVVLGESDKGVPEFCWVLRQDGKILVSFNDKALVNSRINTAASIYGLTAAHIQIGQLLADGSDPLSVANQLDVSINTVRTQIQRMFDKTGVRSQSALVSLLLCAEAPTAK
jgi:DNA-binding CsgD family transcriptional regulator